MVCIELDNHQFNAGVNTEGKLHVELIISGWLDRTGEGVEDVESSGPTFSLGHGHATGITDLNGETLASVFIHDAFLLRHAYHSE
jgi:hypothetical protein